MSTHLPPHWEGHLLVVCGAPRTLENLKLLDAWARAEGGTARWNPLNTTLPLGVPCTDYNSAHVKNYRNAITGVSATAATLANGLYRGILGDLQRGRKTARQIVSDNAAEFDKWGTGHTHILALL
jgi:hypothetical protein